MLRGDCRLPLPEGDASSDNSQDEHSGQNSVDAPSATGRGLLVSVAGSQEGCDVFGKWAFLGPLCSFREEGSVQDVAGMVAVGVALVLFSGAVQPELELVVLSNPVAQVTPVAYESVVG